MTLIEQIEHIRKLNGMSQRKISALADITPTHYNRIVSGKASPSLAVLEMLAKALDCKLCLCFE